MGLFKRKMSAEAVINELLKSLSAPNLPPSPFDTSISPDGVRDEVVYLQAFIVHLVTSAKLFGNPQSVTVLNRFWDALHANDIYDDTFNQRIEDYRWSYENAIHPLGRDYDIGVTFASNCGANEGKALDFFTNIGAMLFKDGVKTLGTFYDRINVIA